MKYLFKNNKLIIFVLLIGFIIRLIGTYPGYYKEGDEIAYGQAVRMILNKTPWVEVSAMVYPILIPWITLITFIIFFIPIQTIISLGINGLSANYFNNFILGKNWINAMYWGRYQTVIFGTLVVLLTFKLAFNYFKDYKIAILASFLVSINYRLVLSSRIGLIDIYNVFFLLLSLISIGYLLNHLNYKNYILTWISVTLSFLVKYQIYALPPLLLIHLLKSRSKFFSKGFIIGALISLILITLSHIGYFAHFKEILEINKYQALKYGFGSNSLNIFPISYIYHIGLGSLLSLFAIGGTIVGIYRKEYRIFTIILLIPVFITSYIYFYYSSGGSYTRNILVQIPILLIFSCIFIVNSYKYLLSHINKNIYKLIIKFLVLIILLISVKDNIINSYISANVYSKESQIVTSQEWIDKNIDTNLTFGTYSSNPAPSYMKAKIKILESPWQEFSYRELLEDKIDYALLDMSKINDFFLWWMIQPTEIGTKFWNKPDNLLSQNYMSLAFREYLWDHTEKTFLTPWQAPGYNFVLVNFKNSYISGTYKELKEYNSRNNNWIPLFFLEQYKSQLISNEKDCKFLGIRKDSINTSSIPGGIRWESEAINVRHDHIYKITGIIKNLENITKDNRNGFLRLNFFEKEPKHTLLERPIITFVSERVYGEPISKEVEILALSPDNAHYLTLSFQADYYPSTFCLESVKILESKNELKEVNKVRYSISDQNLFLPNNGGIY